MTLRRLIGLISLVLWITPLAWATLDGDIEGTVSDPTRAIVLRAAVTVTSVDRGVQRTLFTDERGHFLAALLPVGVYEVRVEVPGFAVDVQRVLVKSAERISVNILLRVAGLAEQETVLAPAVQLVNTNDAQISMSIDENRIKSLPLSSRDPLVLATLSAGVTPVNAGNISLGTGSFNANGGRGRANNITIDNIVSTDVTVTGSAGVGTISLDGLQEFKLITNNFNAEFGRNASAQVQIITRGGSGQFHGTVYEFLKNDKLNARDYFDTTGKASILRRNNFGITAGGPISDRLFYFGHFEGLQIRGAGSTRVAQVPTAAQLAAVTDPTSRAILNDVRLPAAETVDSSGAFGRVTQLAPNSTKSSAFSVRLDYSMNDSRDQISGRYGFQYAEVNVPALTFVQSNLAGYGATSENKPQNLSMSWIHVFGADLINEARLAFGRSRPNFIAQYGGSTPFISIPGLAAFGESLAFPQSRIQNTFQYSDVLSLKAGRHQFRIGGDVHRLQANSVLDSNVRGTLAFGSWTDFAAGLPSVYSQRFGSTARGFRVTNVFGFAQDDFKLKQDLTLNLGVRLEIAGGVDEVNGILSNLDLQKAGSIGGAGTGPLGSFVLGGSSYETNYNLQPRLGFAWNPGLGNWVVRGGYGISHDFIFLNPITNMRFLPPFTANVGLTGGPSFAGANSYASIVAGTSAIQGQARASLGQFSPSQINFGDVNPVVQRDLDNAQIQQWSITIERELTPNLAARVGYVGTAGRHLLRNHYLNVVPRGLFVPAVSESDEIARLAEFGTIFRNSTGTPTIGSNRIDPRFNTVTLMESSGSSNYHAMEADVMKTFAGGYQFHAAYTWSKSIDDASDAHGVLVNDVPGGQNPLDLSNDRAVSQFDISHRLVIDHVWEPQMFQATQGIVRKFLHGWGFNGIFAIQSGAPATILAGTRLSLTDIALTGSFPLAGAPTNAVRASVVGDLQNLHFAPAGSPEASRIPAPAQRGINAGQNDRNSNTSNFPLVQPLLGNFGNLGRNSVRLNPFTNFDWVFLKNTEVGDMMNVQFRAEFYNVFNNTSFAGFNNNLSSSGFGTYTSTDTTARQIQFAVKLTW